MERVLAGLGARIERFNPDQASQPATPAVEPKQQVEPLIVETKPQRLPQRQSV
jgi:hypothetical protein